MAAAQPHECMPLDCPTTVRTASPWAVGTAGRAEVLVQPAGHTRHTAAAQHTLAVAGKEHTPAAGQGQHMQAADRVRRTLGVPPAHGTAPHKPAVGQAAHRMHHSLELLEVGRSRLAAAEDMQRRRSKGQAQQRKAQGHMRQCPVSGMHSA